MAELITDKDEIKKIINEKIRGKKIILSDYYELGIDKKGIQHERVLNIFPQFEKVIAIEKKILKYGNIGYELFYKLDNNITFSIATCPDINKIRFIHAIECQEPKHAPEFIPRVLEHAQELHFFISPLK